MLNFHIFWLRMYYSINFGLYGQLPYKENMTVFCSNSWISKPFDFLVKTKRKKGPILEYIQLGQPIECNLWFRPKRRFSYKLTFRWFIIWNEINDFVQTYKKCYNFTKKFNNGKPNFSNNRKSHGCLSDILGAGLKHVFYRLPSLYLVKNCYRDCIQNEWNEWKMDFLFKNF